MKVFEENIIKKTWKNIGNWNKSTNVQESVHAWISSIWFWYKKWRNVGFVLKIANSGLFFIWSWQSYHVTFTFSADFQRTNWLVLMYYVNKYTKLVISRGYERLTTTNFMCFWCSRGLWEESEVSGKLNSASIST